MLTLFNEVGMSTTMQRSALSAAPNVTPMIDVMLVLLIIFMVIAPALLAGIPAVPPTATNLSAHPEDPADYTVGLDARGNLYLNKVSVDSATLARVLANHFIAAPLDRIAYLRADRFADYARVQSTLDLMARAGARHVGLIAEAPHSH